MGSNTVHLLVVDAHHGAAPLPAHSHKTEMRLAEHIEGGETISRSGVAALVSFVLSAQDVAEDFGVTEMMAFATSAIREAANGEDVLHEVRQRTGVDLVVLSGDDEARLTFLAVRRWFGWRSRTGRSFWQPGLVEEDLHEKAAMAHLRGDDPDPLSAAADAGRVRRLRLRSWSRRGARITY